jgi:hypothetical protein
VELGRYVDGRVLDYDSTTGSFAIGEAPVTAGQVEGYSLAGQVTWASDATRAWFEAAFPVAATPPPVSGKGVSAGVVVVAVLVFVAVVGGAGLWWAWSSGVFQAGLTRPGGYFSPRPAGVVTDTAQAGSDRAFYDDLVTQATLTYESDPGVRESIVNLGNAYFDRAITDLQAPTAQADWRSAIKYYGEALDIERDDPPTRTDMGTCFYQLGEDDATAREFRAVIAEHPDFAMAKACLGLVLERQGDTLGAMSLYQEVVDTAGADDLTDRARVLARERLNVLVP